MSNWSGYDTLVLVTGILTLAIAAIPVKGIPAKTRLGAGALGAVLVIGSFITGSLESFTYPSLVTVGPVLPIVAGVAIVVDAMRRNKAAAPANTPAPAVGTAAPQTFIASAVPPAAAPAPTPDTAEQREAADPATDPARLAELADKHPDTRVFVAANPSTYPDLLEWLAALDDPEVAPAIAARQSQGAWTPVAPAVPRRTVAEMLRPAVAGVSKATLIRDAAAALLLFVALFLPAQPYGPAYVKALLVIATLIALLAIAVPYLARMGLVTLAPSALARVRTFSVLPFAAIAACILLTEMFLGFGLWAPGVGVGVVFGLTAIALRIGASEDESDEVLPAWPWRVATIYAIVTVAFVLLGAITAVVHGLPDIAAGGPLSTVLSLLLRLGEFGLAAGVLGGFIFARRDVFRLLVIVLGACSLVWVVVSPAFVIQSISDDGVTATLLPALAGFALTPAAVRGTTPSRVGLIDATLAVVASLAAFHAVLWAIDLFAGGLGAWAGFTLVTITLLIGTVAATHVLGVASGLFGRYRSLAIAIALLVLGIAYLVTFSIFGFEAAFLDVLLAVLLPPAVGVLAVLELIRTATPPPPPPPVEELVLELVAAASTDAAASADPDPSPVTTSLPPPPPEPDPEPEPATHGFTAVQASDPATSADTLYRIALEAPELRSLIAANPSSYDELLSWLSNLGDPEIDSALTSRGYSA